MDKNNFSERLRKLRKKAGLTQEELAEYVEVHLNTVSRWENDIDTPKKRSSLKLLTLLMMNCLMGSKKQALGNYALKLLTILDRRLLI